VRFGIFIYPGTEPIDLATFGVLSMARRVAPQIEITTIAPAAGEVRLANGLKVLADYGVADAPPCDVVIVTGGPGWMEQAKAEATLAYFRSVASSAKLASVCTGAMILAASGVLDGLHATTKRCVVPPEVAPLEVLAKQYQKITVVEASLVDMGSVITGGGVSLCIDATLHLIAKHLGDDVAQETARIIEYDRAWKANRESFPPYLEEVVLE
jgi:transcriptional regulator GlxA family with amidase domain